MKPDIFVFQTACWSPDGRILLFATVDEPTIYSLTFSQTQDASDTVIGGAKVAVVAIDVSAVEIAGEDENIT